MKWIKLWNRKTTLQHDYMSRFIWFLDNPYYRLKNTLTVYVGNGKADFYAERDEWDTLMRKLAAEAVHPGYTKRILQGFMHDRKRYRTVAYLLNNRRTLHAASPATLLSYYEKLRMIYLVFPYYFFSPWAINHVTAPQCEAELIRRFGRPEGERLYRAVTTPTRLTEMDRLYRVLLREKTRGTLRAALPALVRRYGYLGVYSLLDTPWTGVHLRGLIDHVPNPKRELAVRTAAVRAARKEYVRALRMLAPHPKLSRTARVLNLFAWLRTERINPFREALYLTQGFYDELTRRLDLPKGYGAHLSNDEIIGFLAHGVRPRAGTVKPCELFGIVNDRFVLFREKVPAQRFFKKTVGSSVSRNRREVRGSTACKGRARGIVRIVMVPEDCRKIKKGDILVSNMTHQDYLPGMVRAAAIVTDEGGISCHAAIISRELDTPCVIGTKIATEVFKDGDCVEVDADNGTITKLQR